MALLNPYLNVGRKAEWHYQIGVSTGTAVATIPLFTVPSGTRILDAKIQTVTAPTGTTMTADLETTETSPQEIFNGMDMKATTRLDMGDDAAIWAGILVGSSDTTIELDIGTATSITVTGTFNVGVKLVREVWPATSIT